MGINSFLVKSVKEDETAASNNTKVLMNDVEIPGVTSAKVSVEEGGLVTLDLKIVGKISVDLKNIYVQNCNALEPIHFQLKRVPVSPETAVSTFLNTDVFFDGKKQNSKSVCLEIDGFTEKINLKVLLDE
jgi:hypothetical protein